MAKKLTKAKAAEILHDKTAHGKPLTDKQRKFFAAKAYADIGVKIPNYNDVFMSVGPNFVGMGNSTQGFHHNSWGGTMQMGGNLPGMTGMMYARNGAPSNGKYAKKTKASAQNGKEMTFFQNGLDFTPKSMQQGGYLDNLKLKTALMKERQNKRDSVFNVLSTKYPDPTQFGNINQGMLNYYQQEPKQYQNLDVNLLTPAQKKNLIKQAKGGVIKDNMGQWNHPGKVTQIDSPNITMKGVNYPVVGVSDTGDTKLMHPNQEYAFDGTQVTEYPLNETSKGSKQDKGQKKKLVQLTDFTNNNNMEQGKSGIHIKPSKVGSLHKHLGIAKDKKIPASKLKIKSTDSPAIRKKKQFAINAKKWKHQDGGPISMGDILPQDSSAINLANPTPDQNMFGLQPIGNTQSKKPGFFNQVGNVLGQGASQLGGGQGLLNIGSDLIKGGKMLNQENMNRQQSKQFAALSEVVAQAAETRPEKIKRKYVRPEDIAVQPEQMFPTYGTGTNYLAKNGAEIQNTYAPNTLYTDLGYEPLQDSTIKQFQLGGILSEIGGNQLGNIGGSLGSAIGGGDGSQSGESTIGGTLGGVAGTLLGGPVGGLIGQGLGSLVGGIIGGGEQSKIRKYQREGQQNLNRAAIQQGVQNTQLQNSSFMEEGGWISHDWQPQLITKFGDHSLKDLLKPDPMMNTLRSGGSLKEDYVAPSQRALQTYALGGELQVHDGGYAQPISENPYLPDGGQTIMFKGKSHEEGGMPISYGNNPVEVEGGEPAVKLQDGGTGGDNLVVFGNMKIPHYGAIELGDKDAKNKKFKNYIAELSEKEAKQNKTVEKGLTLVDNTKSNNPFDLLKMNSGKAMIDGGNMKLKDIAKKKQIAANVQNAILDTAKEYNLDSDALSQGKMKKAKKGMSIPKAQVGASLFGDYAKKISKYISPEDTTKYIQDLKYSRIQDNPNVLKKESSTYTPGSEDFNTAFGKARKQGLKTFKFKGKDYTTEMASPSSMEDYVGINSPESPDYSSKISGIPSLGTFPQPQLKGSPIIPNAIQTPDAKQKGLSWASTIGQMWPYFRPTNQLSLDPNQLSGEMYALATNQLDPVQAQLYHPVLDQPYDISLQDQLNANQADFNAIQKQTGYNPAAQASLAAQKYAANSGVLGEQMRINQANKAGIYSKNRDILNDAQLKNLAILDQQYTRQAGAKSATKAIAQQALSSIADKIAQNKLENRTLGVYENLYNYRYDNQGRAYSLNAPAQFNIPQIAPTKEDKKTARNGNIVKAFKKF